MMILYSVSDGPPSVAVRMGLKLLELEYKLQEVDFGTGEHLNDWYAEVNLSMFRLVNITIKLIFQRILTSNYISLKIDLGQNIIISWNILRKLSKNNK